MDRSAELRLPTIAVPVRLVLVGQDVRDAELFVADVARRGRSHLFDDLAAMLDSTPNFVPVRLDGGVRLLAKHAIAWISVRRRSTRDIEPLSTEFPEELSDVFTLYDRQHRVEIELGNGPKITGLLLDSNPADHPRVVDHLNRSGTFVRVWTPAEHLLINTGQIVAVTELGSQSES